MIVSREEGHSKKKGEDMNVQEALKNSEYLDTIELTVLGTALELRKVRMEIVTQAGILAEDFVDRYLTDAEHGEAVRSMDNARSELKSVLDRLDGL